ncbi:MAG: cobalamin biosynthesis protein CobQ [Brevirhabdus sp.]
MNTPAHLIFGLAAFGRPGAPRITSAALAGGLLPDLSLYVLAGTALLVLGIPGERVFNELYFSNAWQTVFAIDNSFILWGALLGVALYVGSEVLRAFAGAGMLHLITDFALHHDDGRSHFWPVSDWRFESPVSYWDSAHHAGIVAPAEGLVCVILTGVIVLRFRLWWVRLAALVLLALELWVIRQWLLFF